MTIERKLLSTSPSGPASDVAEVFSTHLYKGTGGALTVNNGIDLAGEGGMVWFKSRSVGQHPYIHDTERGIDNMLQTNSSNDQDDFSFLNLGVSSTGFSMNVGEQAYNDSSHTYASWTFRKKEKFFDMVTYSGSGSAKTVAHNLGSVPAMMLIKSTNASSNWRVYHSGMGATKAAQLNNNEAPQTNTAWFNDTAPTDSVFTVGVGSDMNSTGRTYIAYLFADNSSEDADDQMIKCGSFTTDGSGAASVNLGWEPQFLLTKKTNASADWVILDSMRGFPTKGLDNAKLSPNTSGVEAGSSAFGGSPVANGFSWFNDNASQQYIFMSIRAPMMKEPEAATNVFAVNSRGNSAAAAAGVVYYSGFPVDLALEKNVNQVTPLGANDRLRSGKKLDTTTTTAETTVSGDKFGSMGGFDVRVLSAKTEKLAWMWKRAKGYMDVVCDTRAFTYGTLNHSLGVVPELIIKKDRSRTNYWDVLPNVSPYDYRYNLYLNDTQAISGPSSAYWNSAPTDTSFGVHYGNDSSSNGDNFVFYLFATLAGISKVGSYTGNGSYQTINCGFSSGARFILIKRTNAAGDWYVWDSVRGIVSGNDPHLSLNTTAAQVTNDDAVDPHSSGFIVNQNSPTNINVSSGTYIFYAIA